MLSPVASAIALLLRVLRSLSCSVAGRRYPLVTDCRVQDRGSARCRDHIHRPASRTDRPPRTLPPYEKGMQICAGSERKRSSNRAGACRRTWRSALPALFYGKVLPLSAKPVAFVFGPENGAVSEKLVYEAAREARAKNYTHLYVIGFAIQPNARQLIEKCD